MRMIFLGNYPKINSLMEELRKEKGFGLEYYFRFNPLLPKDTGNFLDASPQILHIW